jgi:hypothetical protein
VKAAWLVLVAARGCAATRRGEWRRTLRARVRLTRRRNGTVLRHGDGVLGAHRGRRHRPGTGALMIIGAFLHPEERTVTIRPRRRPRRSSTSCQASLGPGHRMLAIWDVLTQAALAVGRNTRRFRRALAAPYA